MARTIVKRSFSRNAQTGAIIVMFTIGLFAIVAMAALAIDGSHMLLNKGRLQNSVDSAALSAAKVLQDGGTLTEARQAVIAILAQNLNHAENIELEDVISLASPDYSSEQVTSHVSVEFSALPDPFIAGADETFEYVRVRVEGVNLANYLAQVFNFNKTVRASAVAGRSTDIECLNKVVPLLVCGDMSQPTNNYGMTHGSLHVMKIGSKQKPSDPDITLGPGNFQLLDLGGPGGKGIEQGLAGEFSPNACVSVGQNIPTEPGNKVGPVATGLNTRFGTWPNGGQLNSTDHPRDINTCEGDRLLVDSESQITNPAAEYYSYAAYYGQDVNENPVSSSLHCKTGNIIDSSSTRADRRKLPIVIGDCDGKVNGKNVVEVKSIGCFFLTQQVEHTGNTSIIIGEYISECGSSGNASLDPDFDSDNFTIVLYRDPDSPDS
ncbi:Tad domain-containing protein [Shewanella fidelis]|uniref:Tad domain-containing protein n=1 Tax=Shewanella fidelis TaxID=173509 RepID=UPI00048A828E|nr:Tad domain-containing protein [Shewanella fidelis]